MILQDMIFIGPNDLALSVLGYVPAKGDEPEFVDASENTGLEEKLRGDKAALKERKQEVRELVNQDSRMLDSDILVDTVY